MTTFETIRYEVDDGLATIALARPEKRNAMNGMMFDELGDAAEGAAGDPAVRCVLVRGDGPSFCSGIDLSVMGDLAGLAAGESAGFVAFVTRAQRGFRSLAVMDKPTIAAVHGHALGAGCQLALACDLRIAAEDASFALLEARYGIIPDLGGPHRLARIAGVALAKEMTWTTRALDADEALRAGLVNRVVPTSTLEEASQAFAREVLQHSPTAAAAAKVVIDEAPDISFDDHLANAAAAQTRCLRSSDHREAVAAFLEGRQPMFGGS